MNDFDELLDRIETPSVDVTDDVARGERALRRRHRWEIGGAAAASAAVVMLVVLLQGGSGPSGSSAPGFATGPAAGHASSSPTSKAHHLSKERRAYLADQRAKRRALAHLSATSTQTALQTYRDVLADHLDPGGTRLSGVSNEQSGGDVLGTKLDWNGGGMLEIVVGRHWSSAGGFYLLDDAGMKGTTYDGHPARVSTTGDDMVVSVQHADGTVVTLIASTSFGNNGTTTGATDLTRQQLLAAAADPRLQLPTGSR